MYDKRKKKEREREKDTEENSKQKAPTQNHGDHAKSLGISVSHCTSSHSFNICFNLYIYPANPTTRSIWNQPWAHKAKHTRRKIHETLNLFEKDKKKYGPDTERERERENVECAFSSVGACTNSWNEDDEAELFWEWNIWKMREWILVLIELTRKCESKSWTEAM